MIALNFSITPEYAAQIVENVKEAYWLSTVKLPENYSLIAAMAYNLPISVTDCEYCTTTTSFKQIEKAIQELFAQAIHMENFQTAAQVIGKIIAREKLDTEFCDEILQQSLFNCVPYEI